MGVDAEFIDFGDYNVEQGRFFTRTENNSGRKVVVIGQTIKEEVFLGTNPIGKNLNIRGKKYKVVGMLEELGSLAGQDQDNIVVIPVVTASRQLGFDRPTWILVKARNTELIPRVENDIEKTLLNKLTQDDFTVLTSEESLDIAASILGIVQSVFVGIAAISLLVGGIGISNIMLVSVTERTREIGLRKAIGAKPNAIMFQFLIEAVILSLTGGLIGLILATLGSIAISFFIPATVTLTSVILAIGFSILVGTIFGVFPAYRASKLEPIEALRSE